MTTGLLAALYAVVLGTAFAASRVRPLSTPFRGRWPWATTIAMIIVGLPTLAAGQQPSVRSSEESWHLA